MSVNIMQIYSVAPPYSGVVERGSRTYKGTEGYWFGVEWVGLDQRAIRQSVGIVVNGVIIVSNDNIPLALKIARAASRTDSDSLNRLII